MSKCNIRPDLNDKIGFRMSKCDIRSEFECQNRISNVYLVYIYHGVGLDSEKRVFSEKRRKDAKRA